MIGHKAFPLYHQHYYKGDRNQGENVGGGGAEAATEGFIEILIEQHISGKVRME